MHAPATASRARYNACLGSPSCRESPAMHRPPCIFDRLNRAERLVRVARWERIARRGRGGRDGGGTRAIAPGTVPRPTPRLSPWAQVHAPEHADSLHLIWLGLSKDMAGSSWLSAAHGGSAPCMPCCHPRRLGPVEARAGFQRYGAWCMHGEDGRVGMPACVHAGLHAACMLHAAGCMLTVAAAATAAAKAAAAAAAGAAAVAAAAATAAAAALSARR